VSRHLYRRMRKLCGRSSRRCWMEIVQMVSCFALFLELRANWSRFGKDVWPSHTHTKWSGTPEKEVRGACQAIWISSCSEGSSCARRRYRSWKGRDIGQLSRRLHMKNIRADPTCRILKHISRLYWRFTRNTEKWSRALSGRNLALMQVWIG